MVTTIQTQLQPMYNCVKGHIPVCFYISNKLFMFVETLIKIIEEGNIDEITREVTPKALANSGRNALLVAMEVGRRKKLPQCIMMTTNFGLLVHSGFF